MEWDTTLRPLLEPLGLDLYDVEFSSGTLDVVVSRAGGVDLESLTKANRTISEWLDANDPIPGRFTLDVSSPGLERRLRTPAHFTSAIGEVVTLRELRGDEPTRRLEGTLKSVTTSSLTLDERETRRSSLWRSTRSNAHEPSLRGVRPSPRRRHLAPPSNKTTTKGARTPSTSKKG